jgi:RNA polymerase sigma-70 factor (ECF subfamily)
MTPKEEERLLSALKKNDTRALKQIFEAVYPLVLHTIVRVVNDTAVAEDLAQEVFIRFWDKRHDIDIRFSLVPYLRKMALNQALGFLRSRKISFSDELPLDQAAPAAEKPDHLLLDGELQLLVEQAIGSLPERCGLIFRLSRFEGMSYQEIADALEISVKTVENQMGKALRLLREKMYGYVYKPE